MNLKPMKYKNYIWPHNPKIYGISYERKVAVNKVPFGRYLMKDMGMTFRVLKGEGEFCGEGAYDEFKKLASVFYDNGPGKLWHPVWQEANAYFVALSLKQEPQPDYVYYTFEFWESYDSYKNMTKETKPADTAVDEKKEEVRKSYIVVSGDTMWGIAVRNKMSYAELVKLNPQIKNPNKIYPGNVIWLS